MMQVEIRPRDLLFFRDARPMAGSSAGEGAEWPHPAVLHSAVLSAFHDQWPVLNPEWESRHTDFSDKEKRRFRDGRPTGSMRFGGLNTIGPFPRKKKDDGDDDILVPTPADIGPEGLLRPVEKKDRDNLPLPLKYCVANSTPPSKKKVGRWISLDGLRKYLRDDTHPGCTITNDSVFLGESRPGVAIDPDSHAHVDGAFYQAEYLRLRQDVCFTAWVEAESKRYGRSDGVDLLKKILEQKRQIPIIFGGQRGVAYLSRSNNGSGTGSILDVPCEIDAMGDRVKWVLLTPALFDGEGWLPDWVGPDGRLMLRAIDPEERRGLSRKQWRARVNAADYIQGELVAARVPKPLVRSGWKLDPGADHAGGEPKPTRLFVPAGAVYYFKCDDSRSASFLAKQLHCRVKSQRLGEKGYGFGVCGTWEFLDI